MATKTTKTTHAGIGQALRRVAMRHPDVEEGIACKGTALESITFKARKKAYLFVGVADARLKLSASLAEAAKLAGREPARYAVGAHGWVTIRFGSGEPPPLERLARWVDESYGLSIGDMPSRPRPVRRRRPGSAH